MYGRDPFGWGGGHGPLGPNGPNASDPWWLWRQLVAEVDMCAAQQHATTASLTHAIQVAKRINLSSDLLNALGQAAQQSFDLGTHLNDMVQQVLTHPPQPPGLKHSPAPPTAAEPTTPPTSPSEPIT